MTAATPRDWTPGWLPRYRKANRSHAVFTRRWHLYVWHDQPTSEGRQSGLTIKHKRRGDGRWRHIQLRKMRYGSSESGYGIVHHFELSWHLTTKARSSISRVKGTKRYLRFKVCL